MTPTKTWTENHKKMRHLEDENEHLKKEVDELKRINDVVSAEMLEPNVGVFLGHRDHVWNCILFGLVLYT